MARYIAVFVPFGYRLRIITTVRPTSGFQKKSQSPVPILLFLYTRIPPPPLENPFFCIVHIARCIDVDFSTGRPNLFV